MCTGYACKETPELMPLPIMPAHKLVMKLAEARRKKQLSSLRPGGKSQVTIQYQNGRPYHLDSVVMRAQRNPGAEQEQLRSDVIEKIIKLVCSKYLISKIRFYINNTGRFVIGGPVSDTGLTGRKIVVDTYGGTVLPGGGAFSGKDPTKVDHSGALMARYIAKNIVAAGLADKCFVRFAYVIGGTEPTEVTVNTFNTSRVSGEKIAEVVPKVFDLSPGGIIKQLDLLRPIFRKTACFGRFGRNDPDFTWERTDKIDELQRLL